MVVRPSHLLLCLVLCAGCGRGESLSTFDVDGATHDAFASDAQGAASGDDGGAVDDGATTPDGLEPLPDGSFPPPKDGGAPDGSASDAEVEIPDTPPPACTETCAAPSSCTMGCNRCDCIGSGPLAGTWACTLASCPDEGTGPCPKNLPLPGQVCGGLGTCEYESQCGLANDVARCNGLVWKITKAPCADAG